VSGGEGVEDVVRGGAVVFVDDGHADHFGVSVAVLGGDAAALGAVEADGAGAAGAGVAGGDEAAAGDAFADVCGEGFGEVGDEGEGVVSVDVGADEIAHVVVLRSGRGRL
jgi:hypothetical protein